MEQTGLSGMDVFELEGTWDEIRSQLTRFEGKRLRVTVRVEEEEASPTPGLVDAALEEIWSTVPEDSWKKLASDLGDNMDHYLYGTPKRR